MRKFVFHTLLMLCVIVCLTACVPVSTDGLGTPGNMDQFQYAGSLWDTMGYNFNLPDESPDNSAVDTYINWYMSHPACLQYLAMQAKPYLYYVYQQVQMRGLPAELALLPMIESAYNPFAYSDAGAEGLWQMMPGTASGFGLKLNWWYDGRRDIVASTKSALDYLAYLGRFFHGDWLLAIAAYDTGEGVVNKAIKYNLKHGRPTDFWDLPLPHETQRYVPRVLAIATIIANPYEYPINLPEIKNKPYLAKVNVGSQIDLANAARLADVSLEELSMLNPGFNQWATAPNGPHFLLLPINKVRLFKKRLAALPLSKRITWHRYKVKTGDNLTHLAKHFKVTTTLIKHVNHLRDNTLRIGETLLIPSSLNRLTKIVSHSKKRYLYYTSYHIPQIHIITHTVKKGDTLSAISKKYHVTPRQVRFWNGIKSNKDLKVGKKLIVWPSKKHYGSFMVHHKIRKGDTLARIAHNNHITITALKKANHMTTNFIKPGKLLIIPQKH